MTRSSHILLVILAMTLMAFVGAGCVEPLRPEDKPAGKTVLLPLQIHLPAGSRVATKAISDGEVAGLAEESNLLTLQVWAYSHPLKRESEMSAEEKDLFLNESPVAYLNVPNVSVLERLDENTSVEVSMIIPEYILSRSEEALKLDFYVLGNGASVSVGSEQSKLKRSEIREVIFEGIDFGTNSAETNFGGVPADGLPLACFFDNRGSGYDISFLKTDPHPTQERMEEMGRVWPEMELARSVARMRFLFAQAEGMTGNHIDSIKLFNFDSPDDPGVIPTKTFVFPREETTDIALPNGIAYETVTWGSVYSGLIMDGGIGEMDDPTILCSNSELMRNMSAQFYDTYVNTCIDSGWVTPKVMYLRESDRPIKGRIYYNGRRGEGDVLVEASRTVDFNMVGLGFPDRTNFYRNHSWTVYAYMIGQHMEVDVRLDDWVLPWVQQEAVKIDGVTTVNVDQDGKFITDTPYQQADSLKYYNTGNVVYKDNGKPKKKWINVFVSEAGAAGVTGRVVIYAPENGRLKVEPVAVDTTNFYPRLTEEQMADYADTSSTTYVTNWFDIDLTTEVINRSVDQSSGIPGLIGITVKPKSPLPAALNGPKAIKLSFFIEVTENGQTRRIAADSELIDDEYHFIINP